MTTRQEAADLAAEWAKRAEQHANHVRQDIRLGEDDDEDLPKDTALRDNAAAMARMWAAVAGVLADDYWTTH